MGLVCDDCDKEDETVEATICPFQEEINDEAIPANLCPNCYTERCQDI